VSKAKRCGRKHCGRSGVHCWRKYNFYCVLLTNECVAALQCADVGVLGSAETSDVDSMLMQGLRCAPSSRGRPRRTRCWRTGNLREMAGWAIPQCMETSASARAPLSSCQAVRVRTVQRSHLQERAVVVVMEVGLPRQQILTSLLARRPSSSFANSDNVEHRIAMCRSLPHM